MTVTVLPPSSEPSPQNNHCLWGSPKAEITEGRLGDNRLGISPALEPIHGPKIVIILLRAAREVILLGLTFLRRKPDIEPHP